MSSTTGDTRQGPRLLVVLLVLVAMLLGVVAGYLVGHEPAGAAATAATTGRQPISSGASTPEPTVVRPSPEPLVVTGEGASTAAGNGSAGTRSGSVLDVSSKVQGELGPGSPARLLVTLTNTGRRAVSVTRVTGRVEHVVGTSAAGPACSTDWYGIAPFAGPRTVRAGATTTVALVLTFTDEPTVNQDSCKGARFAYSYAVEARQA